MDIVSIFPYHNSHDKMPILNNKCFIEYAVEKRDMGVNKALIVSATGSGEPTIHLTIRKKWLKYYIICIFL